VENVAPWPVSNAFRPGFNLPIAALIELPPEQRGGPQKAQKAQKTVYPFAFFEPFVATFSCKIR
jgi:hypothetical protein